MENIHSQFLRKWKNNMKITLKQMLLILGMQFINLAFHNLFVYCYPQNSRIFHAIFWLITSLIVIGIGRFIFRNIRCEKFDVLKISAVIWGFDTLLVIVILLAEIPFGISTFQEIQMVVAGYLLSSIINFFIFFILVFASSKIWGA